MKKNLYDIYENGEKIKAALTAAEVRKYTNLSPSANLLPYYKNGSAIGGKYKLVVTGGEPPQGNGYRPLVNESNKFTPQMLREWRNMNRRYGTRWQNG